MPDYNPTIRGDNTVLFGTRNFYGNAIINSGTIQKATDKLEIRNNDGVVVTTIYYNQNRKTSFEMIVQATAPDIGPGDVLTLGTGAGSAKFIVDDCTESWSNTDVRKYSVNATAYTGIPNPA
ncbi:hypothetical protein [Geminisphaera colitermitum]|uniref:hypothetical protein n=1 Tax=Geminisphaera colitermitum TaxID=1148786 RepID=UPI000158D626|nr:hypothetical protein [Geminisphaera colitermitum]